MKPLSLASGRLHFTLLLSWLIILSCNNEQTTETTSKDSAAIKDSMQKNMKMDSTVALTNHAEAVLSGTYSDTTVTGTAKFDADSSSKVKMVLELTIPAKAGKTVAIHIHEHGDCSDTAKMAHGHWNPTNAQHGKWGEGSFHSGDIGNVKLDGKGKGTVTITTDLWTLGGKPDKNILGKSIIVHGGMDDYKTQPSGNSGTRIGCGVIR